MDEHEFNNLFNQIYQEIDGIIYITGMRGLVELNNKYNLFNHNFELNNYFIVLNKINEAGTNPQALREYIFSQDINFLSKMLHDQNDTEKYIKLMQIHMNKKNLPEEFKNKTIKYMHQGKIFDLA